MTSIASSAPAWQILLALIWLAWAIALFGGFIIGPTRSNRRISRPARLTSSLMLVMAGWVSFIIAGTIKTSDHSVLISLLMAMGISCGLIGDLFLAQVITPDSQSSMIGGMGFFAIGHLFYIAGVFLLAHREELAHFIPMGIILITFWLISIGGWCFFVMHGKKKTSILHRAALPYALLLATTAGAALGLAIQHSMFYPLATGATLFLISDLILASTLFSDIQLPLHHDIVWLTYGAGQMLIIYGVATALFL